LRPSFEEINNIFTEFKEKILFENSKVNQGFLSTFKKFFFLIFYLFKIFSFKFFFNDYIDALFKNDSNNINDIEPVVNK